MSSTFQDAQAELKKQFLGILIATDFECSKEVYSSGPGARKNGLLQMHRLISHTNNLISDKDKTKFDKLRQQIETWIIKDTTINFMELSKARMQLSEILAENFYGELHIGLIPTSTLQGPVEVPENKPANPNKSSRI